ncbi:MAG TPA: DUF4339 domain-containing protein [Luteolibacter sp.]|nr:DUF4339 domain-containing protein [Luteolibacter sp.]
MSQFNLQNEVFLRAKLDENPADWDTRQQLAHLLYDKGEFSKAADLIWNASHIPSTDLDLAFAARILSKDQPRKAIRLLTAVLEHNQGKAVQNMGMANALLHHGMVLQAARFYGAALEADPGLVNPDLEHFILWTDDQRSLWGDFRNRAPKLGELPWMARDPMEALKLTSRVSLHTTPIAVPNLKEVKAEELSNDLYQQEAKLNGKITPPPAVTIPADRVDPKHRRYDSTYGATVTPAEAPPAAPVPAPVPVAPPVAAPVPVAPPVAAPVPMAPPVAAPITVVTPPVAAPVPMAPPVAAPVPVAAPAAKKPLVAGTPGPKRLILPGGPKGKAQAPAEPERELTPEEQAAAEEQARIQAAEAERLRAIAREEARTARIKFATGGVPLPSTDGRAGEWYYIQNNEAVGPVIADVLKDKINDPTIVPPLKMIWTAGLPNWTPVYECTKLWEDQNSGVFVKS